MPQLMSPHQDFVLRPLVEAEQLPHRSTASRRTTPGMITSSRAERRAPAAAVELARTPQMAGRAPDRPAGSWRGSGSARPARSPGLGPNRPPVCTSTPSTDSRTQPETPAARSAGGTTARPRQLFNAHDGDDGAYRQDDRPAASLHLEHGRDRGDLAHPIGDHPAGTGDDAPELLVVSWRRCPTASDGP